MRYTTDEVLQILEDIFGNSLIEIRRKERYFEKDCEIISSRALLEMSGARLYYANLISKFQTNERKHPNEKISNRYTPDGEVELGRS